MGIGTNTPDRLLSISNDNSSILELDVRFTGVFAPIAILSRARGTKAAPTAILNNDEIGYLGYAGYDGASFGRSATIYSKATQNFSGSGKGSSLIFQTTPNDQSFPVDRMLINHNGAIGVSGVPNDNIIFTVGTDATNKIGAIIGRISSSGNSISGINQGIGSGIYGVSENGPGGFFVEAGGANSKAMSTTGDVEMNFGADGTDKLLLNFIGATTRDFEFSNVSGAMDGRLLSSEHEYGLIGTSFRAMWRVAANNFIASTAASYLNYSDQKIKENIAPMQGSLAKLMQLKPVQYDLTKEHYYAGRKGKTEAGRLNETGFVAQELEEVFPKLVQTTEAGLKAASYVGLIPTITASVQEQQVQIETLQKKNEELEARILRLEALLSKK